MSIRWVLYGRSIGCYRHFGQRRSRVASIKQAPSFDYDTCNRAFGGVSACETRRCMFTSARRIPSLQSLRVASMYMLDVARVAASKLVEKEATGSELFATKQFQGSRASWLRRSASCQHKEVNKAMFV